MSATYQPDAIPHLLTTEQAAEYLGLKPQTLAVWRTTKRYDLPYLKVGNSVRYRLTDLAEFLDSRTVSCVAK